MPRAIGIIPARYGSRRLPGKPLIPLNGRPLIYWVWKQSEKAKRLDRLLVATDDNRVKKAVENFGGQAVLAPGNFQSGSDRVASVIRNLDYEIVVNIQGDEPLVSGGAIDKLVEALVGDRSLNLATLISPIQDRRMLADLNVVKVVFDKNDRALYFSRT
jgi:3-deoxy-manno-octulosonate cytidylyltransferase (CMP-KDO synthetase)